MKSLTLGLLLLFSGSFSTLRLAAQSTVFECSCALGQNGVAYRVKVTQEYRPGRATIQFTKPGLNSPTKKIKVEGTLEGFQLSGTALVFEFIYPGPHTVVISEVEGAIQKELDCSSPFTAFFTWEHVVCFSGKQTLMDGRQVPQEATIYDRNAHPYKQVSKVPFTSMYSELSKLALE